MKVKEKTKIAFFLPTFEAGGTERNVANLINGINKKNYNISLILGELKGDFLNEVNKKTSIINLRASNSLTLFLKLIKYFREEKVDVFVSSFVRFNIITLLAKIFSGTKTKIIITEHGIFSLLPSITKSFGRKFFASFFSPSLVKLIYPRADAIICVSKGIADEFSEIVRQPEKIKVINNPIANYKIYILAKESVKDHWFSDKKIPIIISVGRLVKCKDFPNLFRAFNFVLKKQQAHLVIIGDGPEEYRLRQLADKLGLSDRIKFLGFQKNPYKYMERASVFVLSSFYEGFGNVIVEAMACGTPVISTDCPSGPREIIVDNESGTLVPASNAQKLSEAILKLLTDRSLRERFSKAGKKRAQDFALKKIVKQYEDVFQEAIK